MAASLGALKLRDEGKPKADRGASPEPAAGRALARSSQSGHDGTRKVVN